MGGGRVGAGDSTDSRVATVRGMPAEGTRESLQDLAADLLTEELVDDRRPPENPPSPDERGEQAAGLLGQIVDVFVGSRRLAAWALWLQLAAVAHLVSRWQSSPPSSRVLCPNRSTIATAS